MVSSHSRRTNRRRAEITAAAMTAPIAAAKPNNTATMAFLKIKLEEWSFRMYLEHIKFWNHVTTFLHLSEIQALQQNSLHSKLLELRMHVNF